jgi:RsiW-degrading membrane proteinase PrsW (M82 family)
VTASRRTAIHHRPIYQPREPALWVFAAIVVYGAVRIFVGLSELSEVSRSAWALSWLLLAAYAAPLAVLIYFLDLYEREPVSVAIAAFVWGAFAATALALDAGGWDVVLSQLTNPVFAARWGPALIAPVVEEVLKGAGVVLLYLIVRDEVDDAMDGFVYGALCGLGFAVVEDVVYFMAAFGGTTGGVLEGFYVRVLSSGLYGHVLYTGLIGMAIGLVVSKRDARPTRERLPAAVGLVALAIAGHALWNAPLPSIAPQPPITGVGWVLLPAVFAIKGLPLLMLVVVALRLARARERRWLDAALADEVGRDGITPSEFSVLREPAARRAAIKAMRRRAGEPAAKLLARLEREQIDLAMIASRVGPENPILTEQREYCRSLRDALAAMPGAAVADEAAS